MSIYKELNDIKMDLSDYETLELTSFQKKKWESRISKQIRIHRSNKKMKYAGIVVAVFLATGISLSSGMVSFASIPFVAGMIEGFMANNEQTDYTPYKTEIGTTAVNEYGKWTLNEVMVDNGELIISSTFEPAAGIDFNYKTHPRAKVLMNGQNLTAGLSQSIKINDSMYTVYNKIDIPDIPIGETIPFLIKYDNLDGFKDLDESVMTNPWVFDINVPTEQLAATSETIEFNQDIPLGNGQFVHLKKMISSPISTVLYYDWPEQANHIAFKIVSEAGVEILPGSASISPEESYNRYASIDLQSEKFYLVPFESSANQHAKEPGTVPQVSILINP